MLCLLHEDGESTVPDLQPVPLDAAYSYLDNHSQEREAVMMHRLIYDLQMAAAEMGYFLDVYHVEVDQKGFDIALEDVPVGHQKKMQIKTAKSDKSDAEWPIHSTLLLPDRGTAKKCRLSLPANGMLGGAIVMSLSSPESPDSKVDVDYLYADFFTLSAIERGLVPWKKTSTTESVHRRLYDVQACKLQKVELQKAAFVQAKSPKHLLELAGFRSQDGDSWTEKFVKLVRSQSKATQRKLEKQVRTKLGQLIQR